MTNHKLILGKIVFLAKKPIRMCIFCKNRFSQQELIRLQCINMQIELFSNKGRSFYLCKECFEFDEKKLNKAFFRQCKSNKIEFNKQKIKDLLQGENSKWQKK